MASTQPATSLTKELPPPDQWERAAIKVAQARVEARQVRFTAKMETGKDGSLDHLGPDHSDAPGWAAQLRDAFGSTGRDFPIAQLNHLLKLVKASTGTYDQPKLNALLAAVDAVKPEDEIQAMLAVQLVACHEAAMLVVKRIMTAEQIPQVDCAGNLAVKLMRTYTMQVEALSKLKRGGEQTVRVVHVHAGAQAVVGNVTHGGGGTLESEGQSHEPCFATAKRAALSRTIEANGVPMPSASGTREARMPVPRGESRRAAG